MFDAKVQFIDYSDAWIHVKGTTTITGRSRRLHKTIRRKK